MKRILLSVAIFAVFASPAFCWNCPSGQIHQEVPHGTPGSVVVEGISFVCVPTPTPQTGSNSNTNSNQNDNSNSNTNSNKNSNANSNTNNNSAKATGGNASQTQKQGQTQGQTQDQTASSNQTQSAEATNNGNGSNNTTFNSSYKQVRQNVVAYAPDAIPTSPCIKGISAGASSPIIAGNFGAGKVDKGCDSRETARQFALMGNYTAAAKVLCSTDASKRANLTLEDCMLSVRPQSGQVEIIPPVREEAPVPVAVEVPVPVVPPTPEITVVTKQVGECTFNTKKISNVCKRLLDDAARRLEEDGNARLEIVGAITTNETYTVGEQRANIAKLYLTQGDGHVKISVDRIDATAAIQDGTSLQLWILTQQVR